ncbi:hypothetical protein [Microbispora sp. NPDC049633]|uniref:hypothetical protein n=1 Tax=Microbispora sp. NPDC049633 TaxID=3154355 RepID=UPI003422AE7C
MTGSQAARPAAERAQGREAARSAALDPLRAQFGREDAEIANQTETHVASALIMQDLVEVVPGSGLGAVLTSERSDDMNVVVGVPLSGQIGTDKRVKWGACRAAVWPGGR